MRALSLRVNETAAGPAPDGPKCNLSRACTSTGDGVRNSLLYALSKRTGEAQSLAVAVADARAAADRLSARAEDADARARAACAQAADVEGLCNELKTELNAAKRKVCRAVQERKLMLDYIEDLVERLALADASVASAVAQIASHDAIARVGITHSKKVVIVAQPVQCIITQVLIFVAGCRWSLAVAWALLLALMKWVLQIVALCALMTEQEL